MLKLNRERAKFKLDNVEKAKNFVCSCCHAVTSLYYIYSPLVQWLWSISLNFDEAIELLRVVTDFQFKPSAIKPDFTIYDNQSEGYVLCVKADLVSEEYRNFLEKIVESRKLGIRESNGYLRIYGH
jgi:hypothetical protein